MHKDEHVYREARGYSWPQFQPGQAVRLAHGAEHEPTIEAKAAEVHEMILEVAPWLSEPHYAPAIVRYLRAAAREELLHLHIEETARDKGVGKVPARVWEQATAAARLAAQLGSTLGLDPTGHARLKAVAGSAEITAATLADLRASGRQARLAAEQRLAVEASVPGSAAQRPQEPPNGLEAGVTGPDPGDGDTEADS